MEWKGRRQSNNVEDRRGGGGAKVGGGISILGLIAAFIGWKFFGADPIATYQNTQQVTQQTSTQQTAPKQETADQAEIRQFVATVLADTEDVWTPIFQQSGRQYKEPGLVLYSGVTATACGAGQSAMGPFYCPADQKVYIDTAFFKEMRSKMGMTGEQNQSQLQNQERVGDFAMAYVIAHEVGHHVQTLLGISKQVTQAQQQAGSKAQANQYLVRLELQADCFAGLWAKNNHQRTHFLQQGDIQEAMDAAEKIGDDYLQHKAHGHVVPDSFTHGTSAQRQRWFMRGFDSGNINQCDTFNTQQL
ncbi:MULTISPECIES: neutral zinc metallopeptidase [unclassified Acinetobacter]|uniref:KPN_02809 family neutral zinc metallopeptidase n=1 Tax=unclassified Acinetobacter TaxID=196816 RepID=UPI0035BB62C0